MIASNFNQTFYTETGLIEGNSYIFRARSFNSIGFSEYSDEFEIFAAIVPSAPVELIRDNEGSSQTQIAFQWEAPIEDGGR